MKDIRQGNDIGVIWSILQEEKPLNLGSYHLSLYLTSSFGKERITDFKANGNVISWTFFGKNQRHKGTYSLTLVLNEGQENMHTIDACDFIKLVSCTCKLTDGVDKEGIETEVLKLESTVDFSTQTTITIEVDSELSETSENPVQNKVVTSAINAKQDTLVSGENIKTINGESILGGGNIVIEGGSAITPDWNASKGAEGYIKNRTHYFNPTATVSASAWAFDNSGEPKKAIAALNADWLYRFEWQDNTYYIKTDIREELNKRILNDGSMSVYHKCVGGQHSLLFARYGNEFTGVPAEVQGAPIGAATTMGFLKPLDEMFIPDTIARKSELTELSEKIENLPSGESSVFEAVYGETTYNEIIEAHNEGKIVICQDGVWVTRLTRVQATQVQFQCSSFPNVTRLTCSDANVWSRGSFNVEHNLETLANGNVKIKVATQTAEVATPQYVENLLGVIINGDY